MALLLHSVEDHDAAESDHGIVGESAAVAILRRRIDRIAGHDVPVLIRGESGSGKELVANAIHNASARKDGKFVSVNMAAVPASTAAAALFGHVRGAFTGAVDASRGYFGAADKGTLFLDEIGHAPEDVQGALLRALEAGEMQRVGEDTPRKVQVRLLAATDADLEADIEAGEFSVPLLMRLAGFELRVPPLRERRDDIPRLLVHFIRQELDRIGRLDKMEGDDPWLPARFFVAAMGREWIGNVRELRNVARRVVIEHLDARRVPRSTYADWASADWRAEPAAAAVAPAPTSKRRSKLSDALLQSTLERHDFRVELAAEDLGVPRSTLYATLRRRGIGRRASDLHADEINDCLRAQDGDVAEAARKLGVSERALKLRMATLDLS